MEILIQGAEKAFNNYNIAVQSFLIKDISLTNEIIDMEKEIEELFREITPLPLQSSSRQKEYSFLDNLIFIRESITKIIHYSADIAEITINRKYEA
jgi:hypothetical protein